MELPQGYKLDAKSLKIKNGKKYDEITASVLVPQRYHYLTQEDVEYINQECIKTTDCFYLNKSISGEVYAVAFDVVKHLKTKNIDEDKFVEAIPERFRKALRKFKEENTWIKQ